MSDVFISYSRRNSDFAQRLMQKLLLSAKDACVDWEGIPLTSTNWWFEIRQGIEAADSFLFIITPDSMASVVCNMELDYALELGKRIIPIMHKEVSTREAFVTIADYEPDAAMTERLGGKDPLAIARDNWQRLSHINWVYFREKDDFESAFRQLITSVETDLDYVKAHTRYLVRAQEWERENQRADLLLFGEEIDRAEAWLAQAERYTLAAAQPAAGQVVNPALQATQRRFIEVSRRAHQQRRRLARSAQVSIALLLAALLAGTGVAGIILTTTQTQIALARTEAGVIAATLTQVPPTLTAVAGAAAQSERERRIATSLSIVRERLNDNRLGEAIDLANGIVAE